MIFSIFGPLGKSGRELSEFLSVSFGVSKSEPHQVFQNSPMLPQNSVSSLFRNSTLETAFDPFPIMGRFPASKSLGQLPPVRKGSFRSSPPRSSFLALLDFPVFCFSAVPCLCECLSLASKDFRVQMENPCLFGGFPLLFRENKKKQGQEDQGRKRDEKATDVVFPF